MKPRVNRARPSLARALNTVLLAAAALLLASCSSLPSLAGLLPGQPTSLPKPGTPAAETETVPAPTTTPAPSPTPGPLVLTLWVPPQMDPNSGSESAQLLQERVNAFIHANPGVEVRLRVKALSGPGGLLESLTTATAAAPAAVPALVALPRVDLETAALKGLIYPLDGLSKVMDDPDWYPYAVQLSQVEGSTFGLPVGGDAMVLMYRPEKVGITPTNWASVLSLGRPVIIPAGDPQSIATLALYQSAGGTVQNDKRQPTLNSAILAEVLQLYANGAKSGCFPYWLAQYSSDKDAWQAYREQRANFLVTWSSQYLNELPVDSSAIPLPSLGETSYAFSTGWLWSVSDPDPERRETSIRLAEFLTSSDFLAKWTPASSLLPARPSSMTAWPDQSQTSLVENIVQSAQVLPSNDLVASLGPVLQDATLQIIKNQVDPTQAADTAAERLNVQ